MGVQFVLAERPDLVLMDILMPENYDGLKAARRILAEYSVCIIMLTAFAEEEYRQKTSDMNVCGYVLKPITSETLISQVEAALDIFRLR